MDNAAPACWSVRGDDGDGRWRGIACVVLLALVLATTIMVLVVR